MPRGFLTPGCVVSVLAWVGDSSHVAQQGPSGSRYRGMQRYTLMNLPLMPVS